MSEPAVDDTACVQDFLDRGVPIPADEYYCPDGLVIPAGYIERAEAAGRKPDAPGGLFLLSGGPAGTGAKITFRSGGHVLLSGYIGPPRDGGPATGEILLGKDDCVITYPSPASFEGAGISHGG
jgi:hypothetical protein